jgi:hypothetical protein
VPFNASSEYYTTIRKIWWMDMKVRYEIERQRDGRLCATNVRLA